MRRNTPITIQLLGLLVALWSTSAAAKIPICISLKGFEPQSTADYQRLVQTEVRRHPHHTPVERDCSVTLNVEYLNVKPSALITGFLDGQVPSRIAVGAKDEVSQAISQLVSRVLESDPASWVRSPGQFLERVLVSDAGLKRGVMLFGIEVFQHLSRTGHGATFLPGIGVRIRRSLGSLQVGARAAAAYMPRTPRAGSAPQMGLMVALEPEVAWYASEHASTSFYLAASLGLTAFRFDGYNAGRESLYDVGVSMSARAGLELLRIFDYRMDLFVQAQIPLFKSNSPESDIVDAYTPGVQMGVGVAF